MRTHIELAENGDLDSIAQMAGAYFNGENTEVDYQKALSWYLKASERDHTWSHYMIGFINQEGFGVEKNYDLARHYYSKAAAKGHGLAYLNIGVMEQLGQGCEKNATKSAYYYEKAVNLGNGRASINLAQLYHVGAITGKPDYEKAKIWYERALGLGEEQARAYINQVERFLNPKEWARQKVESFHSQPISFWDRLIGRR